MKKTLRLLCCICAFSLIDAAPLEAWNPFTWAKKKWNESKQKKALTKAYKRRDANKVQTIIDNEKDPARKEFLQGKFEEDKKAGAFDQPGQQASAMARDQRISEDRARINQMTDGTDAKADAVSRYQREYKDARVRQE